MSTKKIIAVAGGTGAQASGLVHSILKDPGGQFAVRVLTRNPSSDKAQALAKAGAEVVAADVDDAESVRRAFDGAYGAYCVTFYWDHNSPARETAQGTNLAKAAAAAGVQHAIWSTFEDVRNYVPLSDTRLPTLQGKYKVPHFDAKADVDQVFRDLKVPTTFYLTSFYWENLIYFGSGPQKMPDGSYALVLPLGDKKMPSIAAEDLGKCAYGIFKAGPTYIGQTVGVAGGHLTGAQMAASLTKALGRPIGYASVPGDVYRSFPFQGADDVGNMFQFKADFEDEYCAHRPLDLSRKLNPELQTFDQWLAVNATRIPLPA
jgi:uncharacterized protein YbjT (DUF2867 family)